MKAGVTRANTHRSSNAKNWDSDENRLPHGVERVGYDSETQEYLFENKTTGQKFRNTPGELFGQLREVKQIDHSRMYSKDSSGTLYSDPDAPPLYSVSKVGDNIAPPRYEEQRSRCRFSSGDASSENDCACIVCKKAVDDVIEPNYYVREAVSAFTRKASLSVRNRANSLLRRGTLVSAALKYKQLEELQEVDETQ